MTIDLEQLADGSLSDRNFQKLRDLVIDTGGLNVGVRFGVVTMAFTASATSPVYTVNHGLGRTPKIVIPGNQFINGVVSVTSYSANFTATDFLLTGIADHALTTSLFIPWVVIG